jgi:hypothetical protein
MKLGAIKGDLVTFQLGLIMVWIDLNPSLLKAKLY